MPKKMKSYCQLVLSGKFMLCQVCVFIKVNTEQNTLLDGLESEQLKWVTTSKKKQEV